MNEHEKFSCPRDDEEEQRRWIKRKEKKLSNEHKSKIKNKDKPILQLHSFGLFFSLCLFFIFLFYYQ